MSFHVMLSHFVLSAAVHPENEELEDVCNAETPGIDRLSASRGSDLFSGEEGFSSRTTQVELNGEHF